jgi:hypothetical protein
LAEPRAEQGLVLPLALQSHPISPAVGRDRRMKKTALLLCLIVFLGSSAWGSGTGAESAESTTDCPFDIGSNEEGVVIAWVTDVREFTEFEKEIKTQTIAVGSFRISTTLIISSA